MELRGTSVDRLRTAGAQQRLHKKSGVKLRTTDVRWSTGFRRRHTPGARSQVMVPVMLILAPCSCASEEGKPCRVKVSFSLDQEQLRDMILEFYSASKQPFERVFVNDLKSCFMLLVLKCPHTLSCHRSSQPLCKTAAPETG